MATKTSLMSVHHLRLRISRKRVVQLPLKLARCWPSQRNTLPGQIKTVVIFDIVLRCFVCSYVNNLLPPFLSLPHCHNLSNYFLTWGEASSRWGRQLGPGRSRRSWKDIELLFCSLSIILIVFFVLFVIIITLRRRCSVIMQFLAARSGTTKDLLAGRKQIRGNM